MDLPQELLDELDILDCRQYAGELDALQGELAEVWEQIGQYPVEVKVCASRDSCDTGLYDICSSVAGTGRTLAQVRQAVMAKLAAQATDPTAWNTLSVLFTGIYVGEPEDLLNHWRGQPDGVLNPLYGFGNKIADIYFLGGNDTEDNVQRYITKHFKDGGQ